MRKTLAIIERTSWVTEDFFLGMVLPERGALSALGFLQPPASPRVSVQHRTLGPTPRVLDRLQRSGMELRSCIFNKLSCCRGPHFEKHRRRAGPPNLNAVGSCLPSTGGFQGLWDFRNPLGSTEMSCLQRLHPLKNGTQLVRNLHFWCRGRAYWPFMVAVRCIDKFCLCL